MWQTACGTNMQQNNNKVARMGLEMALPELGGNTPYFNAKANKNTKTTIPAKVYCCLFVSSKEA